eukprot:COSAG02_NODE_7939_length_2777_cov_3.328603_2_plen_39_part_00
MEATEAREMVGAQLARFVEHPDGDKAALQRDRNDDARM